MNFSWLAAVKFRLAFASHSKPKTRSRIRQSLNIPAIVESLEQRKLLTAVISNVEPFAGSYMTGTVPVNITQSLVIADPPVQNLVGASVNMTGTFRTGDVLSFTSVGNITGSYDNAGILTLSGTDTVANYESALRSVTYQNANVAAAISTRQFTFTAYDGLGNGSISESRYFNITQNSNVNNPPIVSNVDGYKATYLTDASPTPITPNLTLTDLGSATISSATITIDDLTFRPGEDTLSLISNGKVTQTIGGITGKFDPGTGVLTLSGPDTVANYQAALRSVSYQDILPNPTPATRRFTFSVYDGTNTSAAVSSYLNYKSLISNVEPQFSTYVIGTNAVTITNSLTITDPGNGMITGATVQIDANYAQGQDVLGFVNTANINGSFDLTSGTLTLTGSDIVANYQAALRSVTFMNVTNGTPTGIRRFAFTVDGATNPVYNADRYITVATPVVVSGVDNTSVLYQADGIPVALAPSLTIADPANTLIASATVSMTITNIYYEDVLSGTNIGNITFQYDGVGTLTLQGIDTLANYQAALRSVTYYDSQNDPTPNIRRFTFQVTDAGGNVSDPVSSYLNFTTLISNVETTRFAYVQGGASQPITNTLTIGDTGGFNPGYISTASVQLDTYYTIGQETLSFTNTPTIRGNWNPFTGTLTLNGYDTVAAYQAALRSVTYSNTYTTQDNLLRRFVFTVDGATNPQYDAYRYFTTAAAPILTGINNYSFTYGANAPAAQLAPSPIITDAGSTTLVGATVSMGTTYHSGEDVLSYIPIGFITGSFNTTTGILTLTGTDTLANYQEVLQTVKYQNVKGNLSSTDLTPRTFSFILNDGSHKSVASVANLTSFVSMISNVETTPYTYTQGNSQTPITTKITLANTLTETISSASVQITSGYVPSEDLLQFQNTSKIFGSFNIANGTMTLNGTDTVADYNLALQSITYVDTSNNPSVSPRVFTISINGATAPTLQAQRVFDFNALPIVSNVENTTGTYAVGTGPTSVAPSLVVADQSSPNISSATVSMDVTFKPGEDSLTFTSVGGIAGQFITTGPSAGTLVLSGITSLANWQTVLRSVSYQDTSNNPNPSIRRFTFTITDTNTNSSVAVGSYLKLVPAITNVESNTYNYVQGTLVPVTNSLTLANTPTGKVTGATVQIDANYVQGEDILKFTNFGQITGNFDPTTGTMTLSGTDTVANYQTALRSIYYQDINPTPIANVRRFAFSVNGAINPAFVVDRYFIVIGVPAISGVNNTIGNYVASSDPTPVAPSLALSDVSSKYIASATVSMTITFRSGEDHLSLTSNGVATTTIGNITGSFDATMGILTLTGADTVANYQAALQSVAYWDTSGNPTTNIRRFTFAVTDGVNSSAPVDRYLNFASLMSLSNAEMVPSSYIQGSPPITITNSLTIAPTASGMITGASVKLDANYVNGQDILAFGGLGNITGNFVAASGTLVLTGTDTVANYQAALQSVTYVNTAASPDTHIRRFYFSVNGETSPVLFAYRYINVIPAPVISNVTNTIVTITPNAGPIALAPSLAIADSGSANLVGATVTIDANFQAGEDVLTFTKVGNITGTFSGNTLTLTGVDSLANYQAVLRSVMYQDTSSNPNPLIRRFAFIVNDGVANNVPTQNYVKFVSEISNVETAQTQYIYGNPAIPISNTLTLAYTANGYITSATVQIDANFVIGQDVLSFTDTANITHTWDTSLGILKLTGQDTVAAYQAALRSITYSNLSSSPTAPYIRRLAISVDGAVNPAFVADRYFIATGAPVINSVDQTSVNYTVGEAAVSVAPLLTITDASSTTLQSATIFMSPTYQAGEDVLTFTQIGNIHGTFNALNGSLTLTGTDTIANYQAVLRSVSYQDIVGSPTNPGNPISTARSFTFVVNDGVNGNSPAVTSTLNFKSALSNVETNVYAYFQGVTLKTSITNTLAIAPTSNGMVTSAKIAVSLGYTQGEDMLSFTNFGHITGNFDAATGILTLSGTDTVANYQAALRAIKYEDVNNNLAVPRTVAFTFSIDGATNPPFPVVRTFKVYP